MIVCCTLTSDGPFHSPPRRRRLGRRPIGKRPPSFSIAPASVLSGDRTSEPKKVVFFFYRLFLTHSPFLNCCSFELLLLLLFFPPKIRKVVDNRRRPLRISFPRIFLLRRFSAKLHIRTSVSCQNFFFPNEIFNARKIDISSMVKSQG
jgi:hypothetical protein